MPSEGQSVGSSLCHFLFGLTFPVFSSTFEMIQNFDVSFLDNSLTMSH